MTVTDQTPTSDEVFAQQTSPPAPTERPFTVEGLVAESNGKQADPTPVPADSLAAGAVRDPLPSQPAPSLDPQPAAPPPPAAPSPPPETEPETENDVDAMSTALALLGESNVAEVEDDLISIEPWDHETIEFMGDTLHVRKPTDQALAGWSLASSRYVKMTTKNDISGLFIARHLSPATYDRVMSRLMDPDDTEYTAETIGKLMAAVVATRGDAAG